jgi:hypothetical protein
LTEDVFAQAAAVAGVRLGGSALALPQMVWLAISGALHASRNFADVLVLTLKLLEDRSQWNASPLAAAQRRAKRQRKKKRCRHDPRGSDPTRVSEEAFVQARQRMPWAYWAALFSLLGQRFQQQHDAWLRWREFRLVALDGTTLQLPPAQALRQHFGCATNGQGRKFPPQARLVMLQFPMARVPWRYELTPLAEGERTVAARLLAGLAVNDLVLMDQGFWSYGLFWQIQRQAAYFAIRLYPGVCFNTLRRLGPKDRLVRWTPSDRAWRRLGLPTSITLRVIDYQVRGFRPSAVVTNVLQPRRVAREQWVHLATSHEEGRQRLSQGLYHRRWEIETTYHELKVRQGLESSLRCRTPQGIRYEVAGHLLLYLLTRWLIVEAAVAEGVDPLRISYVHALNELLDMAPSLTTAEAGHVARTLLPRLLRRIASHIVPFRPGRHYPRPGDTQIKNLGNGKYRQPHKLPNKAA